MILYFATSAGYFNYMLPILKKTGGVLIVNSEDLYNFIKSNYAFVECRLDSMANIPNYHPDVIVFAGNYGWVPDKIKLVQIFHGLTDKKSIYLKINFKNPHSSLFRISRFVKYHLPRWFHRFSLLNEDLWIPFKKLELDRLIQNRFNLICLVGKHMEEKFQNLNLLTNENWKRIGFPRLDCVTNNELSRDEIFKDLNLNPEYKTILYAPTWRGHQDVNLSSIPDMGLEICKSINDNINFIFKPHPCVKEFNEFPEIMGEIEKYIQSHDNFIYLDPRIDIIPLMYISDLFITDFSTVAIEYLAFDRPIIFADHLREKYNSPDLVEIWIRDAGEIVENPNEFKNIIKKSLNNPSEKSEIRKKYCNYFFYDLDGKAGERAAKNILRLANKR